MRSSFDTASQPAFNHDTHSCVTGFRRDEVSQHIYDLVVTGIRTERKQANARLLRNGIGHDLTTPPRAVFKRKVAP